MSDASPVLSDLVEPADIALPLERLRAGDVFVELRHDNVLARAAALEILLGCLPDHQTKLIWIGNPLRSPLTIERFFLQAAGPEADLRVERSPDELVAMLRAAVQGASRCLLIVQQPETLDPEARDTLARIGPLLDRVEPQIQFLFCGSTALRPLGLPKLVSLPRLGPDPALPALAPRLAYQTTHDLRPRKNVKLKLLLLGAALVGTVIAFVVTESPIVQNATLPEPQAAAPPPETPPENAPENAPEKPPEKPPVITVQPTTVDILALRREFDEFLAQQPSYTSRLTRDQRDALFDEFLARQQTRQPRKP